MSKEDNIEAEGEVTEVYPSGKFQVTTIAGQKTSCTLGGKLRQFRIRVVLGDKVTVRLSPYDLTKGYIEFRHK